MARFKGACLQAKWLGALELMSTRFGIGAEWASFTALA